MLKHVSQLANLADYKKACSGDGKALSDKPTSFVFFPKFAFSKTSTGPVLLLGSVPGAILSEAKKKGGACITGKASLNGEGKILLEATSAKVDASAIQPAFAAIGVAKKVAASTDAKPDAKAGAKEDEPGKAPAKKFPDPLTAPRDEARLKTKELGKNYEGEDKKMGWRAQGNKELAETDSTTTLYADEDLKKKLKIGFDDKGRLIDSDGNRVKKKAIGFVANPETGGGLHQFDAGAVLHMPQRKYKRVHHSTPLAGKPISGAGTIETGRKGHIKEITDQSGHYKPGGDLTFQTLKGMAKDKDADGFDKNLTDRREDADGAPKNKPAKVTLVGKSGLDENEWESVKGNPAKINELVMKKFGPAVQFTDKELDRATHEYLNIMISQKTSVSVTSQQYLQTEGNETGIRAKENLVKELHSKLPKLKASNNADQPRTDSDRPGMSAADFKKVGGNAMGLKNVTRGQKPSTLHTTEVAKKLAAEANKGRKLAPARPTGAQSDESAKISSAANFSKGEDGYAKYQGSVPKQKPETKSLGYIGEESDDALRSSSNPESSSKPASPRNKKAVSPNKAVGYVDQENAESFLRGVTKNPDAYKPFKPGKKG